jgi:hypothetical protein
VLLETDAGPRFTKLRGAAQGTAPLVSEIIVAALADAIGLDVPARSLVRIRAGIETLDRDAELRDLLNASEGINLGFVFLDGARPLEGADLAAISPDDAAAIVWLDALAMNPDRGAHNPNLLRWRNRVWLIDHGASLGFHYAWSAVDASSPRRPFVPPEPHVLRSRVRELDEWDEILASRLTHDVLEQAVADVPDSFLEPLLHRSEREGRDSLIRRRAAYVEFLSKRLETPRSFFHAMLAEGESAPRARPAPDWLRRRVR